MPYVKAALFAILEEADKRKKKPVGAKIALGPAVSDLEEFRELFKMLAHGTVCENTELELEIVKGAVACKKCKHKGEVKHAPIRCPKCNSPDIETNATSVSVLEVEFED
jgi:hydrogenase nickel incorporation protein HypA/HybF